MTRAILLVFVFFLVPTARAELCPELHALAGYVRTCSFNSVFTKAANTCNDRIDAQSSKRSAALAAALSGKDPLSAQKAELDGHAANLSGTDATLHALRDDAGRARARMGDYLENLMHPGKINKQLASHLHKPFLDWLEAFPCFADNHKLITRYLGVMDNKIAELDRALGEVSNLAGATGKAIRKLDETTGAARAVKSTKGQGAGAIGAGESREPASSISGTEEDAARRAGQKP